YPLSQDQYHQIVNFSQPAIYQSTYNIFVNASLFETYSTFLQQSILPILNYTIPEFLPLDDCNYLHPTNTTITRDYFCQELRPKHPVSIVVSVGGVSYSLIAAVFSIVLRCA